MLSKLFGRRSFMILGTLLALLSGSSIANASGKCPPYTPQDLELELNRAIDNLTTPTSIQCVADPRRGPFRGPQKYPENGWDTHIDPTFNSWHGNGGSHNLAVVTAAVGLYRFPYEVMRKSPADYQITYVNWWVVYLASQVGEAVPNGYLKPPDDRSSLFYYKGTEQFSNIYDAPVVVSIIAVRYWAYLNGHSLLIRLTQKYLRANWAIYATSAGKGPVWTYDLARQVLPNGTTAPIRAAVCGAPKPNTQFDKCAPRRSGGGYQYNGSFLALAGARSKLGGHWNSDDRFTLFDRAIEHIPSPLQTWEYNEQQGPLLDKLRDKWAALQGAVPQPPPVDENLYGLSRANDFPKINTLIMSTDPTESRDALTYLMSLFTFVRTATTHRIIAWPGWRVSVMENNTNGNSPNMYGVVYQEKDPADESRAIATFLHPWTDNRSGGADGWCRLEAPTTDSFARIHASNRLSNPTPTHRQPAGQPIKEVITSVPGTPPLFHVVLSPGNAPYIDNTPPVAWPPAPKLSPPPAFTPPDNSTSWVFNAVPSDGVASGSFEDWNWVASNPAPRAEAFLVHQSNNVAGLHQHFFYYATDTLTVNAGDRLYAWVYLDPVNPPTEIMLQWFEPATGWEHRAYWGANNIGWGSDGSGSRRYMGPLPPVDQWVLLEVPARMVGAEGLTLSGMAFTLFNGQATWDDSGKTDQGGPAINLAVGKSATQSSTGANAPAPRAVDGNTDGNYFNGSVTHTNYDANAWWQVDLGAIHSLDQVNVWNRTDCCPERLSNFYVLVSDLQFTSTDLTTTLNQPGVSSYYVTGTAGSPSQVSITGSGRYVRVQLASTNYLSMSELEVWGHAISVSPPPPSYQGFHDSVNCSYIEGWIWDQNNPSTRLNVSVFDEATSALVATGTADQFRQDLLNQGKGDGRYGFFIPTPAAYKDGQSHTFRVKVTGTEISPAGTPRTFTCMPPSTSVSMVKPAEYSWGDAGTMTAAGYAQNGSGGVQMLWRDETAATNWVTAPYQPLPAADTTWSNTLQASNWCHTYRVYVNYSGIRSADFLYQGLTAGYCTERAALTFVQPASLAGYGPAGGLTIVGTAGGNAPEGTLVTMWYRDATVNGAWIRKAYAAPVNSNGYWFHEINTNPDQVNLTHRYEVRVSYDAVTTPVCTYQGNNQATWCAP